MIGLLISIMVPALQQARDAARRVKCQTNLRQWAAAAALYATEYNGYLPRRGQGVRSVRKIDRADDWFNALPPLLNMAPYVKLVEKDKKPRARDRTLWVCPSAVETGHEYFFAYAMNIMLSTWWADKPDRIEYVEDPSVQVFMTDGSGEHCSAVPSYEAYSPLARHRDHVNIAYLDGHAATFRGAYVGCGVGDPHRSEIRWIVPGTPWAEPGQPDPTDDE